MVYVWHEAKMIFFAAPATGSSAFIKHLEDRNLGCYLPLDDIVENRQRVISKKHTTLAQMREVSLWRPEFDRYTKVVGIRNPFSWHVAKYLRNSTKWLAQISNPRSWINRLPSPQRGRVVRKMEQSGSQEFSEYLRGEFRGREPSELQGQFHEAIDFYLHQESLAEDAARLFDRLGFDVEADIAAFNVTGEAIDTNKYKQYYDDELTELVYRQNKPFFDRFPEYSFDGLSVPAPKAPSRAAS